MEKTVITLSDGALFVLLIVGWSLTVEAVSSALFNFYISINSVKKDNESDL